MKDEIDDIIEALKLLREQEMLKMSGYLQKNEIDAINKKIERIDKSIKFFRELCE